MTQQPFDAPRSFSRRHFLVLSSVALGAGGLLATAIDGAGRLGRFRYVTVPLMMPILLITLVLSIIWTFSDFQTVYALTGGGPLNSTHLLATLSYQVGIASGRLGEGAAISLTMLPALFVLVAAQIYYLRRTNSA